MKTISFRTRSAIIISSAFIIFLSAFFIVSYFSVGDALRSRGDREVEGQLERLLARLSLNTTQTQMRTSLLQYGSTGEAVLGIVIRSASTGKELLSAGPSEALGVLKHITFPPGDEHTIEASGGAYRCFRQTNGVFVIEAAMSTQVLRETQDTMVTEFGILLLLGSVLLFGIGYLIAGYALRPFNRLLQAARTIRAAASPSPERLPLAERTAEMAELSQTINDILDARDANIAKLSTFTADVAHELRTPLTTMKGELEVELRILPPEDGRREQLQSLLEEVEQLIAIVSDLMLLSEVEQEVQSVQPVNTCDLGSSVRNLSERATHLAQQKGLQFKTEISQSEAELRIPSVRFERMIFNALVNAVSFTDQGYIAFTVAPEGKQLIIDVSDSGKGIAADDLSHLFDRFWRAEYSRNRSYGGAGLGLAISKSIADRYQIAIRIESIFGQGTKVRFEIPPSLIIH